MCSYFLPYPSPLLQSSIQKLLWVSTSISQILVCIRITWGACKNSFLGPTLRDCDSLGLWWSCRFRNSSNLPGKIYQFRDCILSSNVVEKLYKSFPGLFTLVLNLLWQAELLRATVASLPRYMGHVPSKEPLQKEGPVCDSHPSITFFTWTTVIFSHCVPP